MFLIGTWHSSFDGRKFVNLHLPSNISSSIYFAESLKQESLGTLTCRLCLTSLGCSLHYLRTMDHGGLSPTAKWSLWDTSSKMSLGFSFWNQIWDGMWWDGCWIHLLQFIATISSSLVTCCESFRNLPDSSCIGSKPWSETRPHTLPSRWLSAAQLKQKGERGK